MYKIHRINKVHKFNAMHSYVLAELGKNTPVKGLPQIQENLLKLAHHNRNDLHEVEKYSREEKEECSLSGLAMTCRLGNRKETLFSIKK